METPKAFRPLQKAGFDVLFVSHAAAILEVDFPTALGELADVLLSNTIPIEEVIGSGGGETKGTQRLRRALDDRGWKKKKFKIEKRVNDIPRESISHEVDHVKTIQSRDGTTTSLALEIEWNNKDPFFDRDLENFKRLHAEAAISAGLIVTRGASLQDQISSLVLRWANENRIASFDDLMARGVRWTERQKAAVDKQARRAKNPKVFAEAWAGQFTSDKFGAATTHWAKLMERVRRGVGSPCPLLLVGIPSSMITFNEDPNAVRALLAAGAAEQDE